MFSAHGARESRQALAEQAPCRKAWQMATRSGSCSYGHSAPPRPSHLPCLQKKVQITLPLVTRAASAMRCRLKSTEVGLGATAPTSELDMDELSLRFSPIPFDVVSNAALGTETCRDAVDAEAAGSRVLAATTQRRCCEWLVLLLQVALLLPLLLLHT